MFGLDILGKLASSVVDGVSTHYKGKQELKKVKLEAEKQLLEIEAKSKVATQQAKIDMLKNTQNNDFKLDLLATENMKTSYKDELILAIFMSPLVMAFIPNAQGYVVAGFQLMEFIPDWWIYLVIGQVVVIMGMRGMLRDFVKRGRPKNIFQEVKSKDLPTVTDRYKCKHFTIEELVPKELYDNTKDKSSLWNLFDEGLLKDLDTLKEVFHIGTMTINNWSYGGNRNWSGYRTPDSPYYSIHSMHNSGNAFDIIFSDYDAEGVREYISMNIGKFISIRGLEHKKDDKPISWVHIDTNDRGHLLFNV